MAVRTLKSGIDWLAYFWKWRTLTGSIEFSMALWDVVKSFQLSIKQNRQDMFKNIWYV